MGVTAVEAIWSEQTWVFLEMFAEASVVRQLIVRIIQLFFHSVLSSSFIVQKKIWKVRWVLCLHVSQLVGTDMLDSWQAESLGYFSIWYTVVALNTDLLFVVVSDWWQLMSTMLSLPPLKGIGGENMMKKGSRVEKRTWRSLINYCQGQNRLCIGKLI